MIFNDFTPGGVTEKEITQYVCIQVRITSKTADRSG